MLLILSYGPISANFRVPLQKAWLMVHPYACDAFPCSAPWAPQMRLSVNQNTGRGLSSFRMAYHLLPTLELLSAELSVESLGYSNVLESDRP